MIVSLKNAFGDGLKIIELNPKFDKFVTYKQETMQKIFNITRKMVSEKMQVKPKAFWANGKKTKPIESNDVL